MLVLIIFLIIVLSFSFVVFFGAPYVPIFHDRLAQIIEISDLKPGMTLLDLGCGDGKILRFAAQNGIQAVGYELNPILFLFCKLTTFRYRKLVKVFYGNFWQKKFPKTDVVYVFLLPKLMPKLNQKFVDDEIKDTKLVSFSFPIPNKPVTKELNNLFLYLY